MFDHFTFAASGRPASTSTSTSIATVTTTTASTSSSTSSPSSASISNARWNSLWDATSLAMLSPHDIPTPTPSPIINRQSLSPPQPATKQNPSPIADLASQLSSQTIKVEPTHLYDYAYGLPSPAASNDLDTDLEHLHDLFPTVDDSPYVDTAFNDAPSTLIALSQPKYRSTRVWNAATGSGSAYRDFRARRWKRQIGSRILCEKGLEKLTEHVEDALAQAEQVEGQAPIINSNTNINITNTTTPSTPTNDNANANTNNNDDIPVDTAYDQPLPPSTPFDEGFFDDATRPEADADNAEAIRLFRLQRPSGIRKWRDVGAGVRNGVVYRPYRGPPTLTSEGVDATGSAAASDVERWGRDGDGAGNMILSVPRMRRKIGRRKRSREGPREGGGGTAGP